MTKLLSTLVLSAAVFASTGAGAQSLRPNPTVAATTASAPSPFVTKRCSGVACLQGIPQVGVGF